jgi:hypothetical protein
MHKDKKGFPLRSTACRQGSFSPKLELPTLLKKSNESIFVRCGGSFRLGVNGYQ